MTKKFKEPHSPFETIVGPVTITSSVWKGVSAYFLSEETGDSVVITCPDMKQLKKFWAMFTEVPIDKSLTKDTIGAYHFIEKQPEPIKRKLPKNTVIDKLLFKEEEKPVLEAVWIYDKTNDKCEIRFSKEKYSKGISLLGEANRKTANECKLLLRNWGWDREDINSTEIDITDNTDIPF